VTAVAVRGLRRRFAPDTVALDGVDLDFPAGAISVVLGGSGCGKSTLLRCVAGLDQPDAGQVLIGGQEVTHREPAERGVAMVFQNYALYPAKTVAANIGFPLLMARVPRRERRRRVAETAAVLRLDGLLERRPKELSGGQRQRVGIARAIVRRPLILLMDEPLSGLDAQLRTEMRAEIMTLQRRLGTTVVFVTHDQIEAMTMADRIVVMRDGRVEQAGAPAAVFAEPATTYVAGFLGGMNLLPGALCGIDAVTVGVRPEHLVVDADTGGSAGLRLRGRVRLTELLGTEKILHLDVAGTRLRARTDAATPVGDTVTVRAAAGALHHFDPRSGRRRPAPRTTTTAAAR
jgi:ABC-type sugar transport system ATPase subunit